MSLILTTITMQMRYEHVLTCLAHSEDFSQPPQQGDHRLHLQPKFNLNNIKPLWQQPWGAWDPQYLFFSLDLALAANRCCTCWCHAWWNKLAETLSGNTSPCHDDIKPCLQAFLYSQALWQQPSDTLLTPYTSGTHPAGHSYPLSPSNILPSPVNQHLQGFFNS